MAGPAGPWEDDSHKELSVKRSFKSAKSTNPLVDHLFCADPTTVEHAGRLYVYGTNDHQEYEHNGRGAKNTYGSIKSLVVLSTADMVNWTVHAALDVQAVAPWIYAAWAPSIVSRVEADGRTRFYLYFSNSGCGVGVITATSPLGPWSDPLGRNLVDHQTPGLGDCEAPFDPGVVLDPAGTGWLAFGGGSKNKTGSDWQPGNARLVRLGADLLSLDSPVIALQAPYHFEANELNVLDGSLVYTYNTNWVAREHWPEPQAPVPGACSMAYMVSRTPLEPDSWEYRHHYFRNPGDFGLDYCNNHTRLQQFRGHWYLFFHSLSLQRSMKEKGGYRNLCVTELEVDEPALDIQPAVPGRHGIKPRWTLNAFAAQSGATAWRTAGLRFVPWPGLAGLVAQGREGSWLAIRQADFATGAARMVLQAWGRGRIVLRADALDGADLGLLELDSDSPVEQTIALAPALEGVHDLYLVMSGQDCHLAGWRCCH